MSNRKAGMQHDISRRDFIGGVAVAISGGIGWQWSEAAVPTPVTGAYPPIRTGMRGSHDGSFEVAHALRDGMRWDNPQAADESYDLVVVGAGLSGLAAAWYFREANPAARILILDNHDDFGGHARRNEFWSGDRMLLSHGGTENIEDLRRYNDAGRRLIDALGIDVSRYDEFHDDAVYSAHNLRQGIFFGREQFGADKLVVGQGQPSWREFFARTPLSSAAQRELADLYDSTVDYLAEMTSYEKATYLQHTSYEKFLLQDVGISREALSFVERSGFWAIGFDQLTAWVATSNGWPGTAGLGTGGATPTGKPLFCQFPDGNATVARLLVRSLIPSVAPGNTLDEVVTARFDYGALDTAESPVRVRLNSTAINVQHRCATSDKNGVFVTYVRDNKAVRVSGKHCVLACYNAAIPHICPELPDTQKTDLACAVKAPLIYTNVLLSNWKAFAALGIRGARCPGSYFDSFNLTDPTSIGDYRHSQTPDEPIVVRLFRAPLQPELRGRPATEQWRAARASLLTTTFEEFEHNIRDQLGRVLSAGGFDPARDIHAITVNRWPHGYAYGHDPETGQVAWMLDELPAGRAPWIRARKTFGRIAIANSDAMADAMTEGAFRAAHLAVESLLSGAQVR